MSSKKIRTIIISRTDAIGDVVLTLPMAAIIKELLGKETQVIFFGKTYTYPVINCCNAIDRFINYDTFSGFDEKGKTEFLKECNADAIVHVYPRSDIARAAKKAGIAERIGTTNRIYHWTTCNKLIRLSRKNSSLHEAQLNIKLLKPFGYNGIIPLKDITDYYSLKNIPVLPEKYRDLLSKNKFRLVIHPKSHASAREWKMENYRDLIRYLSNDKFQVIITGGEKEENFLNEWIKTLPSGVLNLAGKLSLDELISLLNSCHGIVAASTGPLHLSAALGKHALGIYPPIRPMDPQRWAPAGKKAEYLVALKNCSECRNAPEMCHCMNEVTPHMVEERILKWEK